MHVAPWTLALSWTQELFICLCVGRLTEKNFCLQKFKVRKGVTAALEEASQYGSYSFNDLTMVHPHRESNRPQSHVWCIKPFSCRWICKGSPLAVERCFVVLNQVREELGSWKLATVTIAWGSHLHCRDWLNSRLGTLKRLMVNTLAPPPNKIELRWILLTFVSWPLLSLSFHDDYALVIDRHYPSLNALKYSIRLVKSQGIGSQAISLRSCP